MTGVVTLSIGGPDNYEIDSFETTNADHTFTISTTDPSGCIVLKLGSNSGTNSCVEIKDSNDNDVAKISADKSVVYEGDVSVAGTFCPSVFEYTFFSTMAFGNEKDEVTLAGDRPTYVLLNLIDLCGATGLLKYNTVRFYVYDPQASNNYVFQSAIYKLDTAGGAIPGDYTTYNNSTRVSLSNTVTWTDASGSAGNGDGFLDLTFTENTISQFNGNIQNYYFVALQCVQGGNNMHIYGTKDVGNPNREKEHYFYIGSSEMTESEFTNATTMQNSRYSSNGFCPYLNLFYK